MPPVSTSLRQPLTSRPITSNNPKARGRTTMYWLPGTSFLRMGPANQGVIISGASQAPVYQPLSAQQQATSSYSGLYGTARIGEVDPCDPPSD